MPAIPAAGLTEPAMIDSQALEISLSTAPAFGTPTIMVE